MEFLTVDDVLDLYREFIGEPVLRSEEGLHSAIGRPAQTVFGNDAYPTIALKAAALLQSLAENQPFVDGNKRIAWLSVNVFLALSGASVIATVDETVSLFCDRVARGAPVEFIAAWLTERMRQTTP